MGFPFKSLYVMGFVGVVGLGTLKVIGPTRIAEFFWFQSPARRQVITNGQQNCGNRQIVGNPERATPATGSTLLLGEWSTNTGNLITVQVIERLKADLEETGQLIQARDALKARILTEMMDPEIRNIQAEEIRRLLQVMLEKQDQLLQETAAALSSVEQATMKREQLIQDLLTTNQQQREEIKQMKTACRTSVDSEQISMHAPSTVVSKADSISVAEVEELLRMLNAYIEQAASLIAYSLTYRESPISNKELEDALNKLIGYIGPRLCNDLRSKSKESSKQADALITQIALQAGLANACGHIINNGIPPSDSATLSRIHSDMLNVGQAVANGQPHTFATTSQNKAWEISRKHLTGITFQLITAVGGSLEGGDDLPPQCCGVLDEIVKRSLALHKAISEDASPMIELVTCTVPCDSNFDPSQMEDTEGGGNEITQDTVICTIELGLQSRKRDEIGSREEWDVTMKTKVVLASTLEV